LEGGPVRVVVGITGASGVVYGVRLLELLKEDGANTTYLIVSQVAEEILRFETGYTRKDLEKYATRTFGNDDLKAPLSSGSFQFDAMVIAPCSMKTVAGIAHGFSDSLILRAADVALKEGRTLILVPRETPLSVIHLGNLYRLAKMGVKIIPAMPAFYHKPQSIDDMVSYVVGKTADALNLNKDLYRRWS